MKRARGIRAKRIGERSVTERAGRGFFKNALSREGAESAVEGVFVETKLLREG